MVKVSVVFAAQVWSTGCVGLSRNPIMVDCAHVDFGRTAWPVKGNFTSCEFLRCAVTRLTHSGDHSNLALCRSAATIQYPWKGCLFECRAC